MEHLVNLILIAFLLLVPVIKFCWYLLIAKLFSDVTDVKKPLWKMVVLYLFSRGK